MLLDSPSVLPWFLAFYDVQDKTAKIMVIRSSRGYGRRMVSAVPDTVKSRDQDIFRNPYPSALKAVADADRHRIVRTYKCIRKFHSVVEFLVKDSDSRGIPEISVEDIFLLYLKMMREHKSFEDILTLDRIGIIPEPREELNLLRTVMIEHMTDDFLETVCIIKHGIDHTFVLSLEEDYRYAFPATDLA